MKMILFQSGKQMEKIKEKARKEEWKRDAEKQARQRRRHVLDPTNSFGEMIHFSFVFLFPPSLKSRMNSELIKVTKRTSQVK